MTKVAVLGCSYSDNDWKPNYYNWPYWMAKDNPNFQVYNFAQSGHGIDYVNFCLGWMRTVDFQPDLIIMNIPPSTRTFFWEPTDVDYEIENLFDIETKDNLHTCIPKVAKSLLYNDYVARGDNLLNDDTKLRKAMWEKKVYNSDLVEIQNMQTAFMFEYLDKMFSCPVYYFTYDRETCVILSNLKNQNIPYEYMEQNYPDFFYAADDPHLNTDGTKILYQQWIKPELQ